MEDKTYTVALEPNQGHADAITGMQRRKKPVMIFLKGARKNWKKKK